MKIGIDSSCIESQQRTGVYTYLTSILQNLPNVAPENEYRLYFKSKIPSYDFLNEDCLKKKLLKKPSIFSLINKPLWNTYCLPKELLLEKPDVFFSPTYTLPVFWRPTKSIVALHDISYEVHPEWFPPKWLRTMQYKSRVSAQKASLIITNSEFCKSEIIKYYKVPSKKIYVIHPGISKHFDINKNKKHVKKMTTQPFILSVGSLYPRRNTEGLIKAFKLIAKKIKDYQLMITGTSQNYGQEDIKILIRETNQELGETRIIHKEFIPDLELEQLYKNADLFVSLSNYEGFGSYPMLEAMMYGCPVVAVKTSSIPELLDDAGIYTSHDNIPKIADTIYNTIHNKSLREKMSKSGLERIKLFSTENMTKQFIKACEYVVNN